jgi:hypothetical protein
MTDRNLCSVFGKARPTPWRNALLTTFDATFAFVLQWKSRDFVPTGHC